MNGKSNCKLKSMQATTIHTMFVKGKIIRIYSFCPFSTWNTRQMHFKRSNCDKISHPPPLPLKISHRGVGGGAIKGGYRFLKTSFSTIFINFSNGIFFNEQRWLNWRMGEHPPMKKAWWCTPPFFLKLGVCGNFYLLSGPEYFQGSPILSKRCSVY